MKRLIEKHPFWVSFFALLIVAAVVYLPGLDKFGLYNDDWYLIYDANTQGSVFFHEVYRSDRPARAYVLQLTYNLFGDQVLYYHLSAWLYRVLAGTALFWVLQKNWPHQTGAHFAVALFLAIYPGFLSQINPLDYQSQILSLFLAMLSIALTVVAQQTNSLWQRRLSIVGAVLTGWAYLSLVEYFLGLEILRLIFLVAPSLHQSHNTIKKFVAHTLQQWLPFTLVPFGFLFWRLFLFESERRATDVSVQISQLLTSPLTGLWWLVTLTKNVLMTIVLAWAVPLYQLGFNLRLRDNLIGLALSVAIAMPVIWLINQWNKQNEPQAHKSDWRRFFLISGILTTIAGLLPIVMANRAADFSNYSRYLLASAVGGVMVVIVLIWWIENHHMRNLVIGFLVISSVLTHYANALQAQITAQNYRQFWWQVVWRSPDIRDGTTLIASYPVDAIQEDYFVWGPANLIYRPQKQTDTPIEIRIPAAVLTDEVLFRILQGKGEETQVRRGNTVHRKFGNILLLTQSAPGNCVRLIDGNFPELSTLDQHRTMLVAPASKIENIIPSAIPITPPVSIFGPEPPHEWCYYYQKASLARQTGDWEKVIRLGEKALAEGHYPSDKIEWLPFMQAYTVLGQKEKLHRFVSIMGESPFIQSQACAILSASTTDLATLAYIKESFCK